MIPASSSRPGSPQNVTPAGAPARARIVEDPSIIVEDPVARVAQVFVNGPSLTNEPTRNAAWRAAAGADPTFGYPIPDGANQLRPIPWNAGVNQVSLRFVDVVGSSLDQYDLLVRGSVGAMSVTGFAYDPNTKTGTWTLGATVQLDKLRLVLDDYGIGGMGLDGEWNNGADNYPSGDITPGGDFNFRINVLRGDANGDQVVNALDLADIKKRLTRRPGDGVTGRNAYTIFADLNADGVINALDNASVKSRLGSRLSGLPDPASVAPVLVPVPTLVLRQLADARGATALFVS